MTGRAPVPAPAPDPDPAPGSGPGDPAGLTDPAAIAAALEDWFPGAARDLPWRRGRSGWGALVSEAMLQQTQVARVVPSFQAFMQQFPSPKALATAGEEEVLAAWRGLGYYRRARMLQRAAVAIVEEHGGEVPTSAAVLRELPGVGRYTAGAIASIAFDERTPIVDGNVRRVGARLAADARPVEDRAGERDAWRRATRLVEAATSPAVLNESLMELGATVCTPAAPRCGGCPVASLCRGRAAGHPERFPPPRKPATRRAVHYHVIVVRRGAAMRLDPRPARGLWAGMWQPPTVEAEQPLDWDAFAALLPFRVTHPVERGSFLHRTTHRDVHFRVWSARSRVRSGRWVDVTELHEVPIGNGHRRAIGLLDEADPQR